MPKISVITPTNSAAWYAIAKKSLLRQSLTDWEWIVLWNGGAFVESDDPRIRCVTTQIGLPNVGALKREACLYASAPYVVEFDHDDELDSNCLAEGFAAFETTGAAFVFSDDAHVFADGRPQRYSREYGWEMLPLRYEGEKTDILMCHERPLLLPQNVGRILFAPDHVRAWRKDAYSVARGHDASLKVCDDLDLMIKLYLTSGGKFHHIKKCLYRYSVHGKNTWLQNQSLIMDLSSRLYEANIENLSLVHWKKEGKRCVDLGGGIDSPAGWERCDTHDCDIVSDLNGAWPFEDNSVGVFRAHDIFEHLRNPIHTMNEVHRCLCHGGLLLAEIPSTDGRGAFCDPTHVSWWNEQSAAYYTRKEQARYIKHAGMNCRFQNIVTRTYFPSPWYEARKMPYVKMHLAALKDGPRLHGLIEI